MEHNFISDTLINGRKLRVFYMIDDSNHEALAINSGVSYPARIVIEKLNNLKGELLTSNSVRCDNGPEFT